MKFVPKPGKPNCSCCGKPFKPSQMKYIGYQLTNSKGDGFPLFNCPCGTTVVGFEEKNENKAKVIERPAEKNSN